MKFIEWLCSLFREKCSIHGIELTQWNAPEPDNHQPGLACRECLREGRY
jgi:hypothetical protein